MTPRFKITLLASTGIAVIGAFFWMRSLASWRPVKIGQGHPYDFVVFLSDDERTSLSNRPGFSRNIPYIVDIVTGKVMLWPEGEPLGFVFSFSPIRPELTAVTERKGDEGELRVRELRSGQLKRVFHWPIRKPFAPSILWSRDGEKVAIVGGPNLYQWNLKSGKLIRSTTLKNFSFRHGGLDKCVLSSDDAQIIGCTDGMGKIWQIQSGVLLRSWRTKAHGFPVFFSPDAHTVIYTFLSTTETQTYEFVDTASGKVTWKSDDFISYNAMQGSEIFFPHKTNCEVVATLNGRTTRQLPGPRQSDGLILRVTPDYIYTLNAKHEIFRWRAR